MSPVTKIKGGVTTARGFRAHGIYCGIKQRHEPDVGILISDTTCDAAGVFTRNEFGAACVQRNRSLLPGRGIRALICNSGNANACTGTQGEADNRELAESLAKHLKCRSDEVCTASTGVIGRPLAVSLITRAFGELVEKSKTRQDDSFCKAILTTDTTTKTHAVTVTTSRGSYTVGGCAKGSGMIHPDMATMLGFITTDAGIDHTKLSSALKKAVDTTFNTITVDGDTSTNDMVLAFANGKADITISTRSDLAVFERALFTVCDALARQIVADGEGATKFLEIQVCGAASQKQAQHAARTVASSTLLKCAVYGNDPNWGRILSALGTADVRINHRTLRICICDTCVFEHMQPCDYEEDRLQQRMADSAHITVSIALGAGSAKGSALTCDLSHEYVTINAEYHT